MRVPSPADQPQYTAEQLLQRIRVKGGHVLRMRQHCVFVITDKPKLAQWLLDLGGVPFLPRVAKPFDEPGWPKGSFRDSPGGRPKWDIYVHAIPVLGEETIWEAARVRARLYEVPSS